MPDLVSLSEYKARTGIDTTNTQYDAEISSMIPAASAMIATYTGRDFGGAYVTEERLFEYDGSGYLDIDDCTTVSAVAITIPGYTDVPLDATDYAPMPARRDDSPVYYYLLMPGFYSGGLSPEMGFTRNIDMLAREGRWRGLPTMVKVTAQWGWPVVPEDVKMAAVWTISEWRSREDGEGLAAEAIESFSRSWSRGEQGQEVFALPSRVRDVLAAYAKPNV